ncbi:transposase [Brevibacterium sp. 239c]|uniref:transposase n=1 Tax=Brevibacterium sp. 239c TaxID=1965356 RepID=UPI000C76B15A
MCPLELRAFLKERSGNVTAARRRFSQEFKDELCQEVISTSKPIKSVAETHGVGAEAAADI